MKVVLDTNVLLVSISPKSRFRPIFDAFITERYKLCVTTDILAEYEEVLSRHMGNELTEYALQLIENAPNVLWTTKYFKWQLVKSDADDNKFVDCAIASNADFIVSNDKHFNVLHDLSFPKVNVQKAAAFLKLMQE
ncbi:MAG: putative toxin-antitoxin system toxin component, PIN family [Phaeodactylibacter sp.]|uniref:putative toxin-antitoxin system toxin component, PIN family n=1 Tax=Phaeodactylibacter sp. TaxID=1940289 RepID=UPI0032EEAAA9